MKSYDLQGIRVLPIKSFRDRVEIGIFDFEVFLGGVCF